MKHTPTPKKLDKEATRLRATPCSVVLKVMLLIAKEVGATGVTIASRESEVPQQADSRQTICNGCGSIIDPDVCMCGDYIKNHLLEAGHAPVPMGCDCGRIYPVDKPIFQSPGCQRNAALSVADSRKRVRGGVTAGETAHSPNDQSSRTAGTKTKP